MKSFSKHLTSTKSFGEALPINYYPTMRSSGVFPIRVEDKKIDTVVTFMGYWLLKREIKEVTAIITVRASNGKTVIVESNLIDCVKSFKWSMKEMLSKSHENFDGNFFGSVEIEIFSARDMVFPYPAITLSYLSELGNTFVHTCGRIYNDISDMEENNEQIVPETGFDIISKKEYSPYFSFVNGPFAIDKEKIGLEFINTEGESLFVKRTIENENPYATIWINILDDESVRSFFNDERGIVKINHDLKGFYPRFVVGNVYNNYEAISLSHSYYDTSNDFSESAMWKNPDTKEFFDSVISFPVSCNFDFTELVIYPNFYPKDFNMSFEFYNEDGENIGTSPYIASVKTDIKAVNYINCRKLLEDITSEKKLYLCKVIFDGKGEVPTRMKFGLNIGMNSGANLPTNICFNANVPNEKIHKKKGTFKWCAVFDANHQSIFVNDCSLLRQQHQNAEIDISYWRESDNQSLNFKISLPADGVTDILNGYRDKVSDFLNDDLGWVSMRSSSPHTLGYYVTNFGKGLVGGDHLY